MRANLVASDDFLTRAVNLLSGQFYPIGSVLGRVKYSCPTTGTIHTGDSGNGTCTLVKPGPKIKNGTYTITCAEISSYQSISIATFNVTDPSGAIVGSFEIGNVSGNTADFDSDQLRLKVTTGSTIFVATTDYFAILVNWGVPATGTAGSNTGNGTCPTVLGRKNTIKGVYTATCSAVVEDEGVFDVTDPNGSALGSFHACAYFERTGNGVLSQIEAGYAEKKRAHIPWSAPPQRAMAGSFWSMIPTAMSYVIIVAPRLHSRCPAHRSVRPGSFRTDRLPACRWFAGLHRRRHILDRFLQSDGLYMAIHPARQASLSATSSL